MTAAARRTTRHRSDVRVWTCARGAPAVTGRSTHRIRHERRSACGQLVVMPAIGGAEVVVTSDPPPRAVASYGGGAFDWTPDGEALVYAGVEGGLWLTSSSGGVARRVVAKQPDGGCSAPSISPDGTRVSFVVNQQHVAVAPLDGSTWPSLLSSGADFCFDPSWSPDSARSGVARVGRPSHAVGRRTHRRP